MMTSGTTSVEISNEAASMLQELVHQTGFNESQLLSSAIRIVYMVIGHELAKPSAKQPLFKQFSLTTSGYRPSTLNFRDIEQNLAYALRLLLTIDAEGPLKRIVLEGPKGKRIAVDPP